MSITTILFDVGGVIVVPLDPLTVWERRNEIAAELGFASGKEMWRHFYKSHYWMATKTGQMLHVEMWDKLLRPYGFLQPDQQAQFYSRLRDGEGMPPEMGALFETLHQAYKLGILSNWDDRLELILEELGVDCYFDAILNSHRIGTAKPDNEAFEMALTALEARPEEVFFIDDQQRNTMAAAALGLHTHLFTGIPNLVADLKRRELLPHHWSTGRTNSY